MPAACPHCSGDLEGKWIPIDRFNEVNTRMKAAEATAKLADQHATRAAQLEKDLATRDARYAADMSLADAGITDPDIRDAFHYQYGRLPEENRPPFAEQFTAWKSEADKAPASLRPFLTAKQAAAEPAPQGAKPAAAAPVPARTGASPTPPSPGPVFTRESIRAMSAEQFKANEAAIEAQIAASQKR